MGAGVLDVGRKPKPKAEPGKPTPEEVPPAQYNVRVGDTELERRMWETYRALGLDGANFLRLMIRECLPIYEKKADAIRKRKPPTSE